MNHIWPWFYIFVMRNEFTTRHECHRHALSNSASIMKELCQAHNDHFSACEKTGEQSSLRKYELWSKPDQIMLSLPYFFLSTCTMNMNWMRTGLIQHVAHPVVLNSSISGLQCNTTDKLHYLHISFPAQQLFLCNSSRAWLGGNNGPFSTTALL